jgi:PiT family inorganic phosphate transporter
VAELVAPPHQFSGLVLIIAFLYVSILLGFAGGYFLHKGVKIALRNAHQGITRTIIAVNWIAAGIMAFSNGSNDVQKQLGIIALILVAGGWLPAPDVPLSIRLVCATLLASGTVGGGWRIIRTLGHRIFRVAPVHSLDSQISAGIVITAATIAGAPVSSTHIISTSVIGVGAAENPRRMQWSVGKDILVAIILTIPSTIVLTAGIYLLIATFIGV